VSKSRRNRRKTVSPARLAPKDPPPGEPASTLPEANPPRPSKPLLWITGTLLATWIGFLLVLALAL